MKFHFGKPARHWRMYARMPAIYIEGIARKSYRHGEISRAFGVSFDDRRFFGFVVAGPFDHVGEKTPVAIAARGEKQ